MIFDSHCHPQMAQYNKDREEVINRALKEGVFMICVGTDLKTSRQAIELAQKQEGIWATVGLHPNDTSFQYQHDRGYIGMIKRLLSEEKVVALGEIGLDYYRTEKPEDQKFQKERFIQQLELAKELKKPLILHCRDSKSGSTGPAYRDMIEILSRGYAINGGVMHSFTGAMEEAKKFLDLGLYLGFNGIITFARQYDEIVREVPLERILLETDAPFLTPESYRGQRNEPAYVTEVAKKIAELKNKSFSEVVEQTTKNCQNLFKFNA